MPTDAGEVQDGCEPEIELRLNAPADHLRAVAFPVRCAVVCAVVAAALLIDPDGVDAHQWVGYIAALVWAPLAGGIEAARRRHPDSKLLSPAGAAVDVAVIVMTAVAVSDAWPLMLGPLLLVVAFEAYVGGVIIAVAIASLAATLGLAAIDRHPAPVPRTGILLCYPVVLLAIVLLERGAVAARRGAEGGMLQLGVRSDALMTGVAEAIVVTSLRGRVRQWNLGAQRTFSISADESVGRRCDEVLALRSDIATLDCARGCALLRAGTADRELWRVLDDGARQPLLASARAVADDTGAVVEVVHSFRDITSLKQADEAKTMFLATASHELKTPLAVMIGFSELVLDDDDLPQDVQVAMTAIHSRSLQLAEIVNRLLLSSRIEAGRVDLVPTAQDVTPLLVERADSFRSATGRHVYLDGGPLPLARIDTDAFVSVVDHLLDNAAKYSPGGEPVRMSTSAGALSVSISVIDEGIGMTEEQIERCFDQFWQADSTDSRRFGGSGIGLYIVRALTEGMGGSVSVSSSPGRGSAFTVMLRRADVAEDEPTDAIPMPEVEEAGGASIIDEFMRQIGVGGRS